MIEMVATRGYEASTVVELCALAGVSKRTLYERFPGGRQECFLATYDIVVRTRLLDGRGTERPLLAGELSDLCCVAATSPSRSPDGHRLGQAVAHLEGAPRDTYRSLQSNGVEPNGIGHGRLRHGRLRHTRGARARTNPSRTSPNDPCQVALTMSTRRGIGNHE
jgi:hypothetical protein